MLTVEKFSPEIEIFKSTYDDYNTQYHLIICNNYVASYDTRDRLISAVEIMMKMGGVL